MALMPSLARAPAVNCTLHSLQSSEIACLIDATMGGSIPQGTDHQRWPRGSQMQSWTSVPQSVVNTGMPFEELATKVAGITSGNEISLGCDGQELSLLPIIMRSSI